MRYARTYRDYQRGFTTSWPTSTPYASRRDRGEEDPSWKRR